MTQQEEPARHLVITPDRCLIPAVLDAGSGINGEFDLLAFASSHHLDGDGAEGFWEELTQPDGEPETLVIDNGPVLVQIDGGWRFLHPHGRYVWVCVQITAQGTNGRTWPCAIGDPEHDFTDHQGMITGAAHAPCPPRVVHTQLLTTADARFSFAAALQGTHPNLLPTNIPPGLSDKVQQTNVRPLLNGSALAFGAFFLPRHIQGPLGFDLKPIASVHFDHTPGAIRLPAMPNAKAPGTN